MYKDGMDHSKDEHKRGAINCNGDLLEFLPSDLLYVQALTLVSISTSVMSFSKLACDFACAPRLPFADGCSSSLASRFRLACDFPGVYPINVIKQWMSNPDFALCGIYYCLPVARIFDNIVQSVVFKSGN